MKGPSRSNRPWRGPRLTTWFLPGLVVGMLAPSVLSAQAAPGHSSPACPHGRADAKTVEASGTLPFTIGVVRPVLDSVLTVRGYRGRVSDASGTRLSQPKFTWPRGTEGESWHGPDSPGVEIMVRTVGRGDSTDFSVVSHVVCLSGDPRPESDPQSVETRLEQTAAVEVASAVAEALGKRVSKP